MNKYTKTYISEFAKKASENPTAPKVKGFGASVVDTIPNAADRAKLMPQATAIDDKLNAIKANLQKQIKPTAPQVTEKPTFIKGIPVGAKPSEADLNDVAGYK